MHRVEQLNIILPRVEKAISNDDKTTMLAIYPPLRGRRGGNDKE